METIPIIELDNDLLKEIYGELDTAEQFMEKGILVFRDWIHRNNYVYFGEIISQKEMQARAIAAGHKGIVIEHLS